ncbi:hypothetical protein BDF22DRAFT_668207 [Syncephalis plumigaleata]|nr:hypothetical protein BDF22DRAFT_668207 [Syncephalis plumigaleata]
MIKQYTNLLPLLHSTRNHTTSFDSFFPLSFDADYSYQHFLPITTTNILQTMTKLFSCAIIITCASLMLNHAMEAHAIDQRINNIFSRKDPAAKYLAKNSEAHQLTNIEWLPQEYNSGLFRLPKTRTAHLLRDGKPATLKCGTKLDHEIQVSQVLQATAPTFRNTRGTDNIVWPVDAFDAKSSKFAQYKLASKLHSRIMGETKCIVYERYLNAYPLDQVLNGRPISSVAEVLLTVLIHTLKGINYLYKVNVAPVQLKSSDIMLIFDKADRRLEGARISNYEGASLLTPNPEQPINEKQFVTVRDQSPEAQIQCKKTNEALAAIIRRSIIGYGDNAKNNVDTILDGRLKYGNVPAEYASAVKERCKLLLGIATELSDTSARTCYVPRKILQRFEVVN